MGGGKTVKSVRLRAEWRAAIEEYANRPDPRAHIFTPEEDTFLLEARKVKMPWPDIIGRLKVSENTARKRYRELIAKA